MQLPAVTVTTASPVAKPKKTKHKATSTAPASGEPAEEPSAPLPAVELQPLPGAIVDDQAFVPVTVATSREFTANGGATITDTLEMKPGISGTNFAPGANRPIIRGLDSYRVRTQENGIGTHDVAAISEDHAIPIDPLAADRVEVVRGPATLRYGSQAIGGVVAAENERIPTFIPKGGFSGRIMGGLTSVDDGADGAIERDGRRGRHRRACRRLQARRPRTTSRRAARCSTASSTARAPRSAPRSSAPTASSASPSRAFASLYGIPGEEARGRRRSAHRHGAGQGHGQGRMARARAGVEAVRFWFGASDYAHDELAIHDPAVDEPSSSSARASPTASRRRASRSSTARS